MSSLERTSTSINEGQHGQISNALSEVLDVVRDNKLLVGIGLAAVAVGTRGLWMPLIENVAAEGRTAEELAQASRTGLAETNAAPRFASISDLQPAIARIGAKADSLGLAGNDGQFTMPRILKDSTLKFSRGTTVEAASEFSRLVANDVNAPVQFQLHGTRVWLNPGIASKEPIASAYYKEELRHATIVAQGLWMIR